MPTLAERFAAAYDQVQVAVEKAERVPNSVKLLAVSKTKPIADIEAVAALGQTDFGENYAQEAVEKAQKLAHLGLQWHFIGPIQSNKTRPLAEHMDWLHTVERDKIARRLSEQRPAELKPLQVCIQVNISAEPQKSGAMPADVKDLAALIQTLPNIELRGLMAIVENTADEAKLAQQFTAMQTLFDQLKTRYDNVDTLSMGMSQDLQHAINHGSTMVRIGTAIFGARQPRQSN
ncbi:YggS family pyridoxal phosphate-dependent enzyme [Neiella marina]|uniref:Pyridoxal phosphate homeostasis protein n=1 Tax=Neiella holothuriorum TaxID=2870530 RepID=A0ABS7EJY0_9GAMM|nr:YggS family pyridoxal phosphate-dependent enzyme [Neiella holothuriorum]MBW8192662.1 YggS family pyridoxal phosphate-dependent enzyme [Neiella holothuriorum]